MKKHRCAIVIPTHKSVLEDYEIDSLESAKKNFNNEDIFAVLPNGYVLNGTPLEGLKAKFYDNEFFETITGYNQLCRTPKLYQDFIDLEYDYILIHQLDSYTFCNKLDYFMDMGYDWYGGIVGLKNNKNSKWFGVNVGNGGYSLRKLNKMLELTRKHSRYEMYDLSEDCYFCSVLRGEINTCPEDIAKEFSINERNVITNLPMATHGYFVKKKLYK